jgi:hypothetical protein
MSQPEARLQRKIREALERVIGGHWRKEWAGEFSHPGVGDLVGCVQGLYIEVEVKTIKGRLRPTQKVHQRIITEHGGAYFIARTQAEAILQVGAYVIRHGQTIKDSIIFKAANSSAFRLPARERSFSYGTRNGKNFDIPRRHSPAVAKRLR